MKAKASLKIKTVRFSNVFSVRYQAPDKFSWKKYLKAVLKGRFTFLEGRVLVFHPYIFYPNQEYRILEMVGTYPREAFVTLKDAPDAKTVKIFYENSLPYILLD